MSLKTIGATFILMGTAIGAGMLALPIVSSHVGFGWAALLMVLIWALMLTTGFLVLEVCLAFPVYKNNFDSMAYHTLGPLGRIVAWITTLMLLYALTSAYIAGDSSLLFELFTKQWSIHIPQWVGAIVFTVVFGSVVFWSTRAVDLLNRGLMSIKGIALVATIVLLMPHVNFSLIERQAASEHTLWVLAPVFLTSFGFHTVIPSLANYLEKDVVALKRIIFWGATIPLVIYLLWLLAVLSIIPYAGQYSFSTLQLEGGSAGMMIHFLSVLVHSHVAVVFVNTFSNVAMTTSFLGVTLGLFDFLLDATKRENHRRGRFQIALLTFVPPLAFAIFYPQGFVKALAYAGLCVAVLEVILPALMAFQLRRSVLQRSMFQTRGGVLTLILVFVVGVLLLFT